MKNLNPTIGLEIHVELKTQSKMFCGCPADHFGKPPNTQTCPVCLGLPGALPVPNQKAIDWTILLGLALNCQIASTSKFDRKHYFYPDLPKGYQISQYDLPFCNKGKLTINSKNITITRVHLEEDTAKLQHTSLNQEPLTLIDFNRSGVPLVEIVSEPELTSASEAKIYAQNIKRIITFLNISDADMEKGTLRVEANISYGLNLGYKVEVKNINSFKFLEKAINFELIRQKGLLEHGKIPLQETRGYDEATGTTFSQRVKETATDYRYFPEPDIPPMAFTSAQINKLKNQLPILPLDYQHLFMVKYHIRADYAEALTEHRKLAQKALKVFNLGLASNIECQALANLLINRKNQTEILTPAEIIKLYQVNSTLNATSIDYDNLIHQVISANPDLVAKYRQGKTSVIGVLIGDFRRQSQGQGDPAKIKRLLEAKLNEK